MQHFYSSADVDDVNSLVEEAVQLKAARIDTTLGAGKTLVLIFFNPSLRTRLSTERAGRMLGMDVITMNAADAWGWELREGAVMDGKQAEHVKDAARVISSYADIIGIRTFAGLEDRARDYEDQLISRFMAHATVPVISLESAVFHPLQSLTDLLTIRKEVKVASRPIRIAATWAPHPRALPQAVMNSFLQWAVAAGHEVTLSHPEGYALAPEMTQGCTVTHDQDEALRGADVVYVKNWSSYDSYGQVLSQDKAWMLDADALALTNSAKLLHCLPVRRNVVISDAALDSPQSRIIEQAANRTWAAAAVIQGLLKSTT